MSVRLSDLIAPAFYGVHADMKAFAHSEFWLSGGRGSGKSSFVSIEILLSMLRNSSVNAIVYRKVGATLRESVYGQMVYARNRSDHLQGWNDLRRDHNDRRFNDSGKRCAAAKLRGWAGLGQ